MAGLIAQSLGTQGNPGVDPQDLVKQLKKLPELEEALAKLIAK